MSRQQRSLKSFQHISKLLADNHLVAQTMTDKGAANYGDQAEHINANLQSILPPAIRELSIKHCLALFNLMCGDGEYNYVCGLKIYDDLVQKLQLQTLERFTSKHPYSNNTYPSSMQGSKTITAMDTLKRIRPIMQHNKPFELPEVQSSKPVSHRKIKPRSVSFLMFSTPTKDQTPKVSNNKPSVFVLTYLSLLDTVKQGSPPKTIKEILREFGQLLDLQEKVKISPAHHGLI